MTVLPIQTGSDNPVLRKKTENVPKVTKDILKLIKNMEETLKKEEGLGLAAPQVGKSLRLCIATFNDKVNPMINPEITWKSEEMDIMEEGCLSLPGIHVEVARPGAIAVEYLDAKGNEQERRLSGWGSRTVQHELDHLDGVLIVDYVSLSASPASPEHHDQYH